MLAATLIAFVILLQGFVNRFYGKHFRLRQCWLGSQIDSIQNSPAGRSICDHSAESCRYRSLKCVYRVTLRNPFRRRSLKCGRREKMERSQYAGAPEDSVGGFGSLKMTGERKCPDISTLCPVNLSCFATQLARFAGSSLRTESHFSPFPTSRSLSKTGGSDVYKRYLY